MSKQDPAGEFIGVRAAARILGVHENTVRNWARYGILNPYRLPLGGQYIRFRAADVMALRDRTARREGCSAG